MESSFVFLRWSFVLTIGMLRLKKGKEDIPRSVFMMRAGKYKCTSPGVRIK